MLGTHRLAYLSKPSARKRAAQAANLPARRDDAQPPRDDAPPPHDNAPPLRGNVRVQR